MAPVITDVGNQTVAVNVRFCCGREQVAVGFTCTQKIPEKANKDDKYYATQAFHICT